MKIAQCKYTKAGAEITLTVYFDLKAFDFIIPHTSKQEEDDFIYLACDSIAAAMPADELIKKLFIKRIYKISSSHQLKILCSDGFLIDNSLTVPISSQAFSAERIKISETEQLPGHFKLSSELLNNLNNKLMLFENDARKNMDLEKSMLSKETVRQIQPEKITREFQADKASDILTEINREKREMKSLAENTMKTLQQEITNATKNSKDRLMQRLNEISPIYENFLNETEGLTERIANQSQKLILFKQYVIHALYESARQFHEVLMQKNQDAPAHVKHIALTDFNKKFAGIATISASGTLSNLQEAENNLWKLSLEDLQEIISNDDKANPGLLQKCNTSWTEESSELKIVMKQLGQLNEKLSPIFKDEPQYANQEMTHITRIPIPRSFQFKFTNSALNYKNVVDEYCQSQKEILTRLVNQNKKLLQIHNIPENVLNAPSSSASEQIEILHDLPRLKEASDSFLITANKDIEQTKKFKSTSQQLFEFISTHIDVNLKSLDKNIYSTFEKIQTAAKNADKTLQQIIDEKSKIDIAINHYVLHPAEQPDYDALNQKLKPVRDKLNQLSAKNKHIQEEINRLKAYETVIKRTAEIDLSAAKSNVLKQRNEAKQSLLQAIQNQNGDPATVESLRKNMLAQYSKIDANASDIDKIMTELTGIKKDIFTDLNDMPEISAQNLELKFQSISEKMQALTMALKIMNENVSGLQKLSAKLNERKK